MAKLVAAETVVPRTLDRVAKERLADEVYALQSRVFLGVDKAAFVAYVIDSKAEHTWIRLYRDADGRLGGYLAVHIYEREMNGETIAIGRSETGFLREHRGANFITGFIADRALRYRLAHPGRPFYFLGALVHPSIYAQLTRYADEFWPRPGAVTPDEIRDLMNALGDSFGLECVEPGKGFVRKVGWQTIDSGSDRAYWERSARPGVQFFLRENPGYREGHGLLTLAPVTLGAILRGLSRYGSALLERRARALTARSRVAAAGRES